MLRRLLPLLLSASLGAAGVAVAQPGGIPVTTELARRGAVPVEVAANGIVAAESVVTVRTRVDGQITQVHATEGQMVRRGDRLFTLDSRQAQALLAEREAQLARNRAILARTNADQERYKSLQGQGFAAQQRFEQATADALGAAASVRADEAVVAQIRLTLEFSDIRAEIDGRLGALPIRVGNFVRQAENTGLATVTQMDPILVQFAIPERWLPEVRAAMAQGAVPVRARPDAEGAAPIDGTLVFVDSAVDVTTGTILLKARFANPEFRLWPGQYVQVGLVPRVDADALTVAAPAVQTGQNGRFVYVLVDGQARRRPIELVRTLQGRAVVRGELAAGDKVIIDGAQRVLEGSRVVERNAPPAGPPPQRVSQAG